MTAGRDGPVDADREQQEEAGDEEVGRQREQPAGVEHAAQVDERDQGQDGEAQRQDVGLQDRHGRDQRGDAGGDADGHVEDVVEHQRRGGEQAGAGAEVLPGDGVGAAVARVGADGLAVGDVEDGQERQDRQHDGADVGEAGGAERDEDGEGGLGPVGGGAEAVEAHGGHALEGADLALVLLAVGQQTAEQEAGKREAHLRRRPSRGPGNAARFARGGRAGPPRRGPSGCRPETTARPREGCTCDRGAARDRVGPRCRGAARSRRYGPRWEREGHRGPDARCPRVTALAAVVRGSGGRARKGRQHRLRARQGRGTVLPGTPLPARTA